MRAFPRSSRLLLILALASCSPADGPADESATEPTGLVRLTIDPTPALEIGQLEGDANYTFGNVVSVATLPSGEIAVADASSQAISIFSSDGAFVRRVGGKGEGPGEFTNLVRVYRGTGDSLRAANGSRVMVFDPAGEYVRQQNATEISGDTIFTLDSWLHGRFWVEGALTEEERASARTALAALPAPFESPGYRRLLVAEDGELWIEEPLAPGADMRRWTIASPAGVPSATVELPVSFQPLDIRGGTITGRWIGDSDVHYVRVYETMPTDERVAPPAWLSATRPASSEPPLSEEEFQTTARAAIRSMAMQQEMYYSDHGTYTAEIDSLEWERPEGVEAHFAGASPRAWTAVFTGPRFDRMCALAYGFDIPAGWEPGRIRCAPAEPAAATP